MKKFLVSLTLVGLIGLLTLASLAFTPGPVASQFHADGNICLSAGGPIQLQLGAFDTPTGAVVFLTGEEHTGSIVNISGWEGLGSEAELIINMEKEQVLFNLEAKTFSSHVAGQISVGGFSGKFSGLVSGSFTNSDPDKLLASISESTAQIRWHIVDDGVSAKGSASATFENTGDGFCSSDLQMNGSVAERS